MSRRVRIIKQTILNKCTEREDMGYSNLQSSDVTSILEELGCNGIELSLEEMIKLGLEEP